MIAVGGLSEYAAGNRARLVRYDKRDRQPEANSRSASATCSSAATSRANVRLAPGDVIIIPESMF